MTAPLAVIYVRISYADVRRARAMSRQDPEAYERALAEKVQMHLDECRAYARDEGYDVAAEFADNGKSAARLSNTPLPQREALFAWLREHNGQRVIVLTTEVSRLVRQVTHATQIRDLMRPPLVIACTDGERYDLATSAAEKRFMDAASAAERESLLISERRRRKERTRAAAGHYWGTDPFGYRRVFEPDGDGRQYYTGRLDQDPREAALIRGAARTLIDGGSLRTVVLAWKDAGVASRTTGKPLTQSQVRAILLNPRLNGKRIHRPGDNYGRADRDGPGKMTKGLWDAILDDDTFAALRVILTDPGRRTATSTARAHLLAGLAECGKCGATMKGHFSPGHRRADGTSKRYRSYVCPDPAEGGSRCTRRDANALEQHVIREVAGWLAPGAEYERYVAAQASARDDRARLDALDHEARTLELHERDLAARMARPGANLDVLEDAACQARDRLLELQRERAALAALAAHAVTPARPLAADAWEAMDVADRAAWLRQFVARVVVRPTGRGRRTFDPADVEIEPAFDPGAGASAVAI